METFWSWFSKLQHYSNFQAANDPDFDEKFNQEIFDELEAQRDALLG